jgi:mRNA interferase MazF
MDKDFDKWNELKKDIENNNKKRFFNEWEIWWLSVWLNSRQESCWKWDSFRRPVLILKKLSSNTFIWIPLSSQYKTWTWFASYKQHWVDYTALLYQIRMFDICRFQRRIEQIDENDFKTIKNRLKNLLNL